MNASVLFAGAGGSSLGLEQAGYRTVGYEYWKPAADTHNANGMTCHWHDLSLPELDDTLEPCDLLWASPPCQPFSTAGTGEGSDDERDGFPWTLRIIAKLLPSVVIVENVVGLTCTDHTGGYLDNVIAELEALGYAAEWRVLNAANYGVPQTRERCFIIARRDGEPISWPWATHAPGDSLFHEPWVCGVAATPCATSAVLDRRQTGAPPVDLLTSPAPTVTASCVAKTVWTLHVNGERVHIPNALIARWQGFPSDYQWCGSRADVARQIGNAVPPTMARVLAEVNRP